MSLMKINFWQNEIVPYYVSRVIEYYHYLQLFYDHLKIVLVIKGVFGIGRGPAASFKYEPITHLPRAF